MSDGRLSDRELEAALRDVGARLRYPPSADLLPAVRARIEAERRRPVWLPRMSLVPALATAALLLVATLAFQPVGAGALEAIGIGRLTIFRGASPPPTPVATPGRGTILPGGVRVASVDEAARQAGFAVLVPVALGQPDEVYVVRGRQGPAVYLVYAPRADLPAAKQTGIGALVMQAAGRFEPAFLGKVLPPGARAEEVTVNGRRGVWVDGAPHEMFFVAPNGEVVFDTLRLAGNVLVWDQDGSFVRLEADLTKERALLIASSIR